MAGGRLLVREPGGQAYAPCWAAMQAFTDSRSSDTVDELWLTQHPPVFTLGQAAKPEHLLNPGGIQVVQVDRGGQVTYHGPGQLMAYTLFDLRRLGLGARAMVSLLEQSLVELLAGYGIEAYAKCDAPGVYVADAKIASLGLRIRRGCAFHGLALNVAMDLEPFLRINPCGYAGLRMTQLSDLGGPADVARVGRDLTRILASRLAITDLAVTQEAFVP